MPADYPNLLALGIGLTDLNKREWGNDDELTAAGFDVAAFTRKMKRYRPGAIAFTSKYTASLYLGCKTGDLDYGLHAATLDGIPLHVLPSTSGQAVRYFNLKPWAALACLIEVGFADTVVPEPDGSRRGAGGAGGLRPQRTAASRRAGSRSQG
jgi:TDG/mug DNA glycosylase family protein